MTKTEETKVYTVLLHLQERHESQETTVVGTYSHRWAADQAAQTAVRDHYANVGKHQAAEYLAASQYPLLDEGASNELQNKQRQLFCDEVERLLRVLGLPGRVWEHAEATTTVHETVLRP